VWDGSQTRTTAKAKMDKRAARESSLSPASQPEDPIEDRDANERRDPACEGNAQCDLRLT